MLTIKAPIQLHIAQGLTGNSDTFGERIRGNYGMLGARYTPKDLLFLLIAPPELPEEMGGMTTLVSQQNSVDVRSVTMDVVNNVVNRIMLDGTQQFTYQDQVYITSVLNKLGVTNVEQFMEQIRQLRTENESTVQLTKLYRSELERVIQRQTAGEHAPALPISAAGAEEEQTAVTDPRTSMSLNILQRLGTTKLYETVHNFQRNWSRGATHFQNNEFRLAEQLRFSNSVSLAQIKQQIYEQPQLNLLHHLNRYETSVMLEAPENEEAVLSQAAAAALVSAVDNTVTEVLNRPQIRQEQWLRIENAISQTAENTLSRFESYHSQTNQNTLPPVPDAQAAWNYYAQELQEYRALYQQMYPKAAEHGRVIGLPEVTRRELLRLTNVEQGDEIRQILTNATQLTQDQRQTLLQAIMLTPRNPAGQEGQRTEHTRILREERSHELERRLERERLEQILHPRRGEEPGAWEEEMPASGREIPAQADVQPMILTDRLTEIPEGELTIEQMEQIEQYNRTLVHNAAQEMQRTQPVPEREIIHRTDIFPGKSDVVMSSDLTEMNAPEGDKISAAPQGDYIDQTSRTVIEQIQQEIRSAQTQPGGAESILHQTTILPGEQSPMAPMVLTDRELPEEGEPLTQEQVEYIDQSSHSVLENIRQEFQRTRIQYGDEKILQKTEILLEKDDAVKLLSLAHGEGAEEDVLPAGEQAQHVDHPSQSVLESIRQELHRTQIHQEGAENLLHQTTVLPGAQTPVSPMSLTNREAPETEEPLTEEQAAYIHESGRTVLESVRQELRHTQSLGSERSELLHQTERLREEHSTVFRSGEKLQEVIRQLGTEQRDGSGEEMISPVTLTGREEELLPEVTAEYIERVEENNRTVLQKLEQERQRVSSQPAPGAYAEGKPAGVEGASGEQEILFRAQGTQAVGEVLRQLRAEGQEVPAQPEVFPVSLTVREAEEQAPELLVEQIERIEAHNRTLLQNMQQQSREREVHIPSGPDLRRTMRDALRALEEPEQVLREIYDRQETVMVHPELSPEEENALNRVDPASRAVYEQILSYQKDPEGTLAKGLLRPVTMGAFQAEIRKVMQDTPLELEHQSPEERQKTELIREQSEIILEKFHRMQPQQIRQEIPRKPGAVQIVHKEVAPDVTEELLEQLQQQRTQTSVKSVSNEEITHSQSHQVDVKQIEQKIVTQTTEDITELVNRTLARQMRTISDQVYRQMEKRLQSERSRRGRF